MVLKPDHIPSQNRFTGPISSQSPNLRDQSPSRRTGEDVKGAISLADVVLEPGGEDSGPIDLFEALSSIQPLGKEGPRRRSKSFGNVLAANGGPDVVKPHGKTKKQGKHSALHRLSKDLAGFGLLVGGGGVGAMDNASNSKCVDNSSATLPNPRRAGVERQGAQRRIYPINDDQQANGNPSVPVPRQRRMDPLNEEQQANRNSGVSQLSKSPY